jgi:hypothetical protein
MNNILLISYFFEPCQAIAAKRWSEFYELFEKDDEIEVVVLTANWCGKQMNGDNVNYIGDDIVFNPPKSINRKIRLFDYIKHPSLFIRSINKEVFSDQWYSNALRWIDKNSHMSFDIVISSYTPINAIRVGSYAKDIFKAKHIVDMRDMMSIQGQKKRLPVINYIDNKIDRYWLRSADEIISIGPTICNKASKFYNKNIYLIYNAFSASKLREKQSLIKAQGDIVFSYLGTLGIKRNPRNLLLLMDRYCQDNPKISIVVNFASQDNPYEFISDISLTNVEINWTGYITGDELIKLKDNTDCFIILEDFDANGKENVTGKIFEYMMEQKPVIASCHPNSDIKEILRRSGIGEIVINYTALKDYMNLLINNKILINKEKINIFSSEKQYILLKTLF